MHFQIEFAVHFDGIHDRATISIEQLRDLYCFADGDRVGDICYEERRFIRDGVVVHYPHQHWFVSREQRQPLAIAESLRFANQIAYSYPRHAFSNPH
jgi:hypothetical protein